MPQAMATFRIALCAGILFPSLALGAQLSAPSAKLAHYDLEHTQWQALTVESLAGATLWSSAWLVTGGPRITCRWCESNGFDESIRSALRADNPRPPALISHGLSVGAVPVLALTGLILPAHNDRELHRGLEDSWIVANTFLLTSALGDYTKHLVARERPAFHHHIEGQTEFSSYPKERNKSFFSLDTAWAFSIVSSAATLAHLRGYSSRNYIMLGGGALALGAGTLRIVGDAHWTTDVLAGAAVGTAIGIAIPVLLHGRRSTEASSVAIAPLDRASGVSLSFVF